MDSETRNPKVSANMTGVNRIDCPSRRNINILKLCARPDARDAQDRILKLYAKTIKLELIKTGRKSLL